MERSRHGLKKGTSRGLHFHRGRGLSLDCSTERLKKTYGRTTERYSTDCLVISFIYVRVYYWTAVEWKELLAGSSLSYLGLMRHEV